MPVAGNKKHGAAILLIEDDDAGREMGSFNLARAGYEVEEAATGENGLEMFSADRHDLVITDVNMPGISGLDVLKAIKAKAPQVPVVVVTAYGNIELAVEAIRAGAFDFVGKPFQRDHLLVVVNKALEHRRLELEVRDLRIRAAGVERPIVHQSDAMSALLIQADRVAASPATVLITGESGTGKELVARRIHARSSQVSGPFVVVNCAAMPPELLESELFGHERGAFTGAHKNRPGRFRQANNGTLFMDEIGELDLVLQAKLLRVLQEQVVDPVGSDESVPVNVRFVAATNRYLPDLVTAGSFRDDLFYRLAVVEITVPPLRAYSGAKTSRLPSV